MEKQAIEEKKDDITTIVFLGVERNFASVIEIRGYYSNRYKEFNELNAFYL